ncbi:serine hydrolase domain-containing protein [Dactylosporangium sucinum]|uniref:Serine hydrolase n=1 Tax=Dactylosporangium sucinum TaxID=1424081 RepID=A0A917X6K6_9ACTN|nr:serine hydrolase domain-containing protein [Dactylosporangium sucinum]GGM79193.1 serine hydrolase [Dactylosporangium sucinum]
MLDWSARSGGPALDRALRLVRARGGAAQLCVVHDGQVVADVAHGCAAGDLFWVFSTSKPFTALLVHRLAERGALSLDDTLAQHWPAFAANGKEPITVRHVLQHRSGLPVARSSVADALAMTSWERSVRAVERARPRFPAGGGPAYQYVTYGFLLGELLQRIMGTPLRELLHEEILAPLGLRDTFLGVPDAELHRQVPVRARGPAAVAAQAFVNRRETRQAVIPAAGISTTARDLAVLYQALLDGGGPLLSRESVAAATTPTSDGTVDAFIRLPIRWSQGFQLGGPGLQPDRPRPMGRTSSPEAFGHNGSNVCVAWADPARRLVVAYLTNRLESPAAGAAAHNAVAEAILAEFPPGLSPR